MSSPGAHIQLWGKGFRISQRSEEFQRLVPVADEELEEHEPDLSHADWGTILKSLYRLDDATCERQFYLGLSATAVHMVSVGRTRDRNDRQSVVAVVASGHIDWESDDLGNLANQLAGMSRRLVEDASTRLHGAPAGAGRELRDGSFFPSRVLPLSQLDGRSQAPDWKALAIEVARWKGIKAIATPYLVRLGANVLVGTRYEGERLPEIAGVVEPPSWRMLQLSDDISLWQPVGRDDRNGRKSESGEQHLAEINETLKQMRADQNRQRDAERRHHSVVEAIYEVVNAWFDLWRSSGKRRK